MRRYPDLEAEMRDEEARLASLPHVLLHLAHLALTNRALATAILSRDTEAERFGAYCHFLDDIVLARLRGMSPTPRPEPRQESQTDEPMEWDGTDGVLCSAQTAKASPCRARAVYSLDGAAYCSRHYPFSNEHRKATAVYQQQLSEYFDERTKLLAEHDRAIKDLNALNDMNRLLSSVAAGLGLSAPAAKVAEAALPSEAVRVDGLDFQIEDATYGSVQVFWLRDPQGGRIATLCSGTDGVWCPCPLDSNGSFSSHTLDYTGSRADCIRFCHLWSVFYRLRTHRDLSWYASTIEQLISNGASITSAEPIEKLCGIKNAGSGWRVFAIDGGRRTWATLHASSSEVTARWEFSQTTGNRVRAACLVNPLHQIVEEHGRSPDFW